MSDMQGWKGGRRPEQPGGLGPLLARLRDIERRLSEQETRAPLRSASISSGGLTVRDGGGVSIQGGGGVAVEDGGGLTITDGGGVTVEDGGTLIAEYPDGSTAVRFGPLHDPSIPGSPFGHGLLVQNDAAGSGVDIFRAQRLEDGTTAVWIGQDGDPAGQFAAKTNLFSVTAGAFSLGDVAGTTGVWNSGNILYLRHGGGGVRMFYQVGSMAANAAFDDNGTIYRVSSSLRYKQDVEPLTLDLDADMIVDALLGSTWRDRGEVERDPETTNRYPGHIAEQLHDAGLSDFIVYDAEGRPDAISYDRLSAALAHALRQTRDELAAVTQRVAALEQH